MKTYTICYSGTDCYLDQSLVLREPQERHSYNPSSGYIPSKVCRMLTAGAGAENPPSTTMNGCGAPYQIDYKTLPIRIWELESEIEDTVTAAVDTYVRCHEGGKAILAATDSALGLSMEVIAIAGIARMLGVTLDLVPAGGLEDVLGSMNNPRSSGDENNLVCPKNDDSRWNQAEQSENGHYSLRWSEIADLKIKAFLKDYDRVVLLGHSRGGVSCIIASNYLAEWFPSLTIKIAALDPVPGTGNWWSVLTQIPDTKDTEYLGIYAIDETSAGFNGVVPRVKNKKYVVWDPLDPQSIPMNEINMREDAYTLLYTRGRHATVPGSRSIYGNGDHEAIDNNVGASGNLANAYVVKKLISWGVDLVPIDSNRIEQWINAMNSSSDHFAQMRNYNYSVDLPYVNLIPNKLGLLNGRLYFNARGISSSNGNNPIRWNYLEAFIPYARPDDFPLILDKNEQRKKAEEVNKQRGLIDAKLKLKYQSILESGHVHPWTYLAEADFN